MGACDIRWILGRYYGDPVLVHGRAVELTAGTTTVPHETVPVGMN